MKWRKAAAFLALTMIFAGTDHNLLNASQPGSSADPLVTKSYVDEKIRESLGAGISSSSGSVDLEEIITDVIARIEFLYGNNTVGSANQDSVDMYGPVSATRGQVILGGEGTEIILRSGSAQVYSSGQNGLVDLTQGQELFHSQTVVQNHLLIVPRDDGRGVQVVSDEAWFMIKGAYAVLNA